jgi:hypothetical protein
MERKTADPGAARIWHKPQKFVPFVPAPSTTEFELWLRHLQDAGMPMVGIGRRWGPRYPAIAAPTSGAPPLHELDEDMQAVKEQRSADAQPSFEVATRSEGGWVTADNYDEIRAIEDDWEEHRRPLRWHPRRHPALCMRAAASRHIGLRNDQWIAEEVLELKGSQAPYDKVRFRTVGETVARGDELWRSLGAWPWAAFDDAPPAEWWLTEIARQALAGAISAHLAEQDATLEKVAAQRRYTIAAASRF